MLVLLLNKLVAGEHLSQRESAELLDALISAEASDAQVAGALVALAAKGETAEELAGFAEIMRRRATRVTTKHETFVDTCGTGGSAFKTFNVSTAAAFVVASAGLPVAKHGNVGVSSKAGSADVLRALGIIVEAEAVAVGLALDDIGIGFMFAPLHHHATRRVAQVRRELGVRTIFNLLGPLTNPANAPFQLIGVSHPTAAERVALALSRLGTRRAWVVRGRDGLDEITLSDSTVVFEATEDGVRQIEIGPEDFGLAKASIDHLRGGSAADNAAIVRAVLTGERTDAARDLVVANAAAALHIAGNAHSLKDGVKLALEVITSGAAWSKVEQLREFKPASASVER
ncbi:MAG: anthranilate phosphoribosyltransferase [Acidobacteriota bacterium]